MAENSREPSGLSDPPEEKSLGSDEAFSGKSRKWFRLAAAIVVLMMVSAGAAVLAFSSLDQPPADGTSTVNFVTTPTNVADPDDNMAAATNMSAAIASGDEADNTAAADAALNAASAAIDAAGSSMDSGTASLADVKIEDWSWESDPDFGVSGALKWRVSVRNQSSRVIDSVKIEFSAYDVDHHLLTTTFHYIESIPPGEARDGESFADYHGGEDTARVTVADVRFAD